MLESLTIFSLGGLVLYQYTASPSLVGADDVAKHTQYQLNNVISKIMLQNNTKLFHISEGLTFCWMYEKEYIVAALYPDILFEGPRAYLRGWCEQLLKLTVQEYAKYKAEHADDDPVRPDPKPFEETFLKLLETSKTQRPPTTTSSSSNQQPQQPKTTTNNKGKEKRQWHDGNAKVTDKAMAELDMSSSKQGQDETALMERALNEARQAFLPDEEDLKQDVAEEDSTSSWSASITSLLQQFTGNKVLTEKDLEKPLEQMQQLLVSKNVAQEIATDLCASVKANLVGKKLNSLYRVQTAVKQAFETSIQKLLERKNSIDLLRAVLTKRGDGALFRVSKRTPYVISVMGINGIGKTTSLAKLAYYFKSNGCKPILVAGDTFRSGAVEQLKVHAGCLDLPIYSQGYSKDPSAVTKAAIQYATENENDVVLVDTAGRMQNNVPLMKALGKLTQENKPDCILMVCEALVGHDGLSQFRMFQQALGGRKIDGLILTKYDTVSDKVGAALTLTHETGTPIVFIGTGQKYHHLKKLSVNGVINSLFS